MAIAQIDKRGFSHGRRKASSDCASAAFANNKTMQKHSLQKQLNEKKYFRL